MTNFEKAVEFVRRRGDEVEQARLGYVLTGQPPSGAVVAALFAGQRPDGGWAPFWAEDYASLDATCYRLAQAEQLGIGAREPAARQAVAFLASRQASDGSWQEDESVADLAPPWAAPSDRAATLYLTANCGFWLALFGDRPDQVLTAAAYLQTYMSPEGPLPSFMHTHWLAAGLWHKVEWKEAVYYVLAFLDARIEELPASNLSWLITTLLAAGLTPEHPLLEKAAGLLAKMQEDDGRWPSEDGPARDVHSTVEALRALRPVLTLRT